MAAIAGFVGDGSPELLSGMSEALSHRGRVGAAQHWDRRFAVCHRQDATSGSGLARRAGLTCVLDGSLLNRDELLERVGAAAQPMTDAQLMCALYEREGVRAFERLDGPAALALADGHTLHLVRDALGERPLYFAEVDGLVLFACEIKALLAHPSFRVVPELESLLCILVYSFIPGTSTAFRGVQQLEPGTRVELPLAGGPVRVVRYWDLQEELRSDVPEAEQVAELRQLLRSAVRRRLPPAGTPIGAFLSGGIDSSAVVALLAELGRPPICYSAGFGYGHPNELLYASLVATRYELDHRVIDVEPEDFVALLPRVMWGLDDPLCDCITVPNFVLASAAARDVPVIFNGEGGDPLFGGPKNKFMILGEWYGFLGGYDRARAYLSSYHKFYDYLPDLCTAEFLHGSGGPAGLEEHVRVTLDDERYQSFLNRLMHVNIRRKGGQNILVKVDKMLTPNGVVACSPLFDKRLTEHSFTLPAEIKRRGDAEKYAFKKAVEDLLPASVVYRKKAGMGVPLNHWFKKTVLRRYTRDLLGSERARSRGYFRQPFVERLLAGELPDGHLGRDRSGELLWMLLAIELWHRVYVDGERP